MSTAQPGLRERKKLRTREAIIAAAFELFRERGYDATTISDIAEAADIAPRTFFAYFAAKEDVVFHNFDEYVGDFEAHLRDRPPGETTFDALRAWVAELVTKPPEPAAHALRAELVRSAPVLAARHRANLARFEAIVAEAVSRDLALPSDHLRPRLVAAAAVAAVEALGRDKHGVECQGVDANRALAVLDEAVAFLAAGLEALRDRPPV